jgi:hypothetical protein
MPKSVTIQNDSFFSHVGWPMLDYIKSIDVLTMRNINISKIYLLSVVGQINQTSRMDRP